MAGAGTAGLGQVVNQKNLSDGKIGNDKGLAKNKKNDTRIKSVGYLS